MSPFVPRRAVLPLLLSCCLAAEAVGAEYQWSAPMEGLVSKETGGPPRAFLWIPGDCREVRAVVIAPHNMEEIPILENPGFRKTLADLGFAEIWITPPPGNHFRFDRGAAEVLDRTLQALAAASGYAEIARAPLVPLGHSATASYPFDVAAWNPGRTLAAVSISGQWPYFRDSPSDQPNGCPDWNGRTLDGVPCLTTKGEYEIGGNLLQGWYAGLAAETLRHPETPFTQVVEPGGDHFEASDEKIALIGLFLRKAAQYRLRSPAPEGEAPRLIPIRPADGWLYDAWRLDREPLAPAAPAAAYKGNRSHAYWAFDEEMARAIEAFQGRFRNQKPVFVGFRQSGGLTVPTDDHALFHLKFEPTGDGLTFHLAGAFWDKVPVAANGKEGATGWTGMVNEGVRNLKQGDPLEVPPDEDDRLSVFPICGPVKKLEPGTFAIRFDRVGTDNVKRSNSLWFWAAYPGDGTYKRFVQRGEMGFPLRNTAGDRQTLSFPDIPDQQAGQEGSSMPPVKLAARSSAGAPVHYYVREGPAEVDDDGLLSFTPIPPRSAYPIRVTVVAWQWGRSIPPLLQSAEPVTKTFSILGP